MLVVAFVCFSGATYAEQKTAKEIYAEIMKKKLAGKKKESVECRAARESAKEKYKDINALIVISKAQYRKHSEELDVKDLFRVVNELVHLRVDTGKETKAVCEKKI